MGGQIILDKGKIKLLYAMQSGKGDRSLNEDAIGFRQSGNRVCFALADGLGGHGGGDVASQLVVNAVLHEFVYQSNLSENSLEECFECAQKELLTEQSRLGNFFGMKSTLVLCMTDDENVLYGHIGDSRLYEFENGQYLCRTLDHSVPQMLALAGEIKECEIRGHTDRNRLLRAMGVEWGKNSYKVVSPKPLKAGQAYLLCSDGFWEWIEEERMEACLREAPTAEQWMECMEREVRKNGEGKKMDNYSAIVIMVKGKDE
ncbi:MAG: protein phosphatase 2C domain-containing protein [Lachnospiraceae bacterium]|nr:protein phosphatase 2C domain-containing protein [Lachnospiraceae bacterium]